MLNLSMEKTIKKFAYEETVDGVHLTDLGFMSR